MVIQKIKMINENNLHILSDLHSHNSSNINIL